ncbi:MAG: hypothetical protein V3V66_05185 [Anaerolineales bacterium]
MAKAGRSRSPPGKSARTVRWSKWKKTVTLTKEEAEDLLNTMEKGLNEADSRGRTEGSESPYQLVEGNILVGEAGLAALPPDGSEILGDLVLEVDESDPNLEKLKDLYRLADNYEETIDILNGQLATLEEIASSPYEGKETHSQTGLAFGYVPWPDSPGFYAITISSPVKQSDGTYKMISETKPISDGTIPTFILTVQSYLIQVLADLSGVLGQIEALEAESDTEDYTPPDMISQIHNQE